MPARARRPVFYAAYGSNLSAARFACYIVGGTAPGASRALPGARDRRPPESWHALRVPGRLCFSGHSQTWGGAPAFLDPALPGEVLVRAWLLAWDQFEDVMAQENGRGPIRLAVERGALEEGFSLLTGPGRYDRLVCLGRLGDVPIVTCTAPGPLTPAPPSPGYLAHIATGLRETFDLDDAAVVTYLEGVPGASPDLVRAGLRAHPGGEQDMT